MSASTVFSTLADLHLSCLLVVSAATWLADLGQVTEGHGCRASFGRLGLKKTHHCVM